MQNLKTFFCHLRSRQKPYSITAPGRRLLQDEILGSCHVTTSLLSSQIKGVDQCIILALFCPLQRLALNCEGNKHTKSLKKVSFK